MQIEIDTIKNKLELLLGFLKTSNRHYEEPTGYKELLEHNEYFQYMFKILKESSIDDNSHTMDFLRRFYEEYDETQRDLFLLEDLFEEGWIAWCIDQWDFVRRISSDYDKVQTYSDKREEQILFFLRKLSKEVGTPCIRVNSADIDIKKAIDFGLLDCVDQKYIINAGNKLWRDYGKYVLAVWWDEIIENNMNEQEQWFDCQMIIGIHERTYRYVKHIEEMLEYALCQLEKDKGQDFGTYIRGHQRKLYIQMCMRNGEREMIPFPKSRFECAEEINNNYELYFMISNPYNEGLYCAVLCAQNYNIMSRDMQRRFLKCLQIPYIYVDMRMKMGNHKLLVDSMDEPMLFSRTFSIIIHEIMQAYDLEKYPLLRDELIEDICESCFDILQKRLENSFDQEIDKWINVLVEISRYLNEEGFVYFKNTISRRENVFTKIYRCFVEWYKNSIIKLDGVYKKHIDQFYDLFVKEQDDLEFSKNFAGFVVYAEADKDANMKKIYNCYRLYINRAKSGKIFDFSKSFWNKSVWIDMMRYIAVSDDRLDGFLNLFTGEEYKKMAGENKGKSPVLYLGNAMMLHLYMITILLIDVRNECVDENIVSKTYVELFANIDVEGCDPMSPESSGTLRLEWVIERCMDAISFLMTDDQKRILSELEKQSADKILFLVDFIKKQDVRRQLLNTLLQREQGEFRKNIFFIPTFQRALEKMAALCIDENDKVVRAKMTDILENNFSEFCNAISKKGKRIKKDCEEWIDGIRIQILLIKQEEEAVLSLPDNQTNNYYKAYVYLNRDASDDLKKAMCIYEKMVQAKGPMGAYINYLVSCVRLASMDDADDELIEACTEKAVNTFEQIHDEFYVEKDEESIIYSNMIFLCVQTDNKKIFYNIMEKMPDYLRFDYSCAVQIIKMYIALKDNGNAEKYYKELELYYGQSEEIEKIRREIYPSAEGNKEAAVSQDPPKGIANDEKDRVENLRAAMNQISGLTMYDKSRLQLPYGEYKDPIDSNLLNMVIDAVEKLNLYCDYLGSNDDKIFEDAYTKLIQLLFNAANTNIYHYQIMDQTKEGTAQGLTTTGRQSVGSLDAAIYHKNNLASIIEAVKIDSLDKSNLEEHIRKVAGYNYGNVPTVFMIIYAYTDNIKKLWNKYQEWLKKLQNDTWDNSWYIDKYIKKDEIELVKTHANETHLCMCATEHKCIKSYQEYRMYHIMIDVKKTTNKEEARAARGK